MLVDAIILLAFATFAVLGYLRGFVKSAASLVRISISVIIAFLLARPVAAVLSSIFKLDKTLANAFSMPGGGKAILTGIIAIVIFFAIRIALYKLVKFAEKSREKSQVFNKLDRWLGALFGAARFLFFFSLCAVVFYLLTRMPFLRSMEDTLLDGSHVAKWLYKLVVKLVLVQGIAAIAPK